MVEIFRGKDDVFIWQGWKKTTTGVLCNGCTTTTSRRTAPSVRTSGSTTGSLTCTTVNPHRQRCPSAPFLLQKPLKKNNNDRVVHNKEEGTACPCCRRRRSTREILSRSSSPPPPPPPPQGSRTTTNSANTTRSSSRSKIAATTVKTITKHKMNNKNLWHQRDQTRRERQQQQRERNQHYLLQKKHLDVSIVGNFYEGSKSRHARHRLVLREFDASNAVALQREAPEVCGGDTGITARTSSSSRRNGTSTSQRLIPAVHMGEKGRLMSKVLV